MARLSRLFALAFAAVLVCSAIDREPLGVYQERRQQLAAEKSNGVIILLGFEADEGRPGPSRFRQQNEFYYLTGWNQPGAAVLLLPAREGTPYREIFFMPRPDPHDDIWTGSRIDPSSPQAIALTGFADIRRRSDFENVLRKEQSSYSRAYGVASQPSDDFGALSLVDLTARLEAAAAGKVENIRETIDRMRLVKSPGEILLLEKAAACSSSAHLAAMRAIQPGRREYHLQAAMTEALLAFGCERHAYAPIIAAGSNSLVLHYTDNEAELVPGDIVVLDVGGEYSFYASDLTRTLPVSGRFSDRQREIYDSVLKAQRAVIAAIRPGMTLAGSGSNSLTQIARNVFEHDRRGLSRSFTHSVGHHVGLAVHDPGDSLAPLQPGMVITVEPGLYLPDEGFGIRIEDVVLVTEDGARVLSAALPSEADEIERLINEN